MDQANFFSALALPVFVIGGILTLIFSEDPLPVLLIAGIAVLLGMAIF